MGASPKGASWWNGGCWVVRTLGGGTTSSEDWGVLGGGSWGVWETATTAASSSDMSMSSGCPLSTTVGCYSAAIMALVLGMLL